VLDYSVMDPKNWTLPLGGGRLEERGSKMVTRRKFSPEFKAKVVLELIKGERGLMQASRDYGIKDTVLSRWKQEFLERAPKLFCSEGSGERKQMQTRIADLERMVGRLTLELDIAKKVFSISGSTKRNNGNW